MDIHRLGCALAVLLTLASPALAGPVRCALSDVP